MSIGCVTLSRGTLTEVAICHGCADALEQTRDVLSCRASPRTFLPTRYTRDPSGNCRRVLSDSPYLGISMSSHLTRSRSARLQFRLTLTQRSGMRREQGIVDNVFRRALIVPRGGPGFDPASLRWSDSLGEQACDDDCAACLIHCAEQRGDRRPLITTAKGVDAMRRKANVFEPLEWPIFSASINVFFQMSARTQRQQKLYRRPGHLHFSQRGNLSRIFVSAEQS